MVNKQHVPDHATLTHGRADDGAADSVWATLRERLTAYPFLVRELRPIDASAAIVYTSTRVLEARIISEGSAWLRRAVLDFAARHRFRATQRFVLTVYHEPVIRLGSDRVLYVTDGWPGDRLTTQAADLDGAAHNLAQFHRAVEQFGQEHPFTQHTNASIQYGTWIEAFSRGVAWFRAARASGVLDETEHAGTPWHEWLARWEEQAGSALRLLESCGYRQHMHQAERESRIAWGHYGTHCLRKVAPKGVIATLQLNDPIYDDPLLDLASLCEEISLCGSTASLMRGISVYEQARPISNTERMCVYAYAAFPHFVLPWIRERMQKQTRQDSDQNGTITAGPSETLVRRQRQTAMAILSASGTRVRP